MADATAKGRYIKLAATRKPYWDRAVEAAKLTIPSLAPPEGHSPAMPLPEPNQGLGARLVVHLGSYFTSTLLPPGRNVFRLGVSPEALLKAGQQSIPSDLEQSLTLAERIPHAEIARRNWRSATTVTLQHLLVAGNAMERMLDDNSIVTYPLNRYVVVRAPSGKMIEFIVEEPMDPAALPDELRALHQSDDPSTAERPCLYTWGKLTKGVWEVTQEFKDQPVGKPSKYTEAVLPFFALRWQSVAGEDYGRSKVEEHIADLRTFDGLSKAMRDGAAMASRNITMIRPNAAAGINLRRKLSKADNGEYVIGNPEDVQMLNYTNTNGLQIVQVEVESLRRELGAAFMLTSSVTRNAERVTAEEIRSMTQELDSVQGGAYSMLSLEMLKPRVDRLLFQMRKNRQLPDWPDGTIDPTILTGLAALGRESDTSNVINAMAIVQQAPENVREDYVKWSDMLKKGFNGLDLADCVRTDAEAMQRAQARQQQQTQQDMATAAAGPVAQAVAQNATQ